MRTEPGTIQPAELLAHMGWARSLARVLVHEPSDLDDLVQQTMVAALTRPPKGDRPVRPWLAKVMRNFARERVRGARRREAREADRGPLAEEAPSPEELATRIEQQRLLADVLLELPEDLRTTLVLRYYEDLSSAEIARRTQTPAGTVRWRLKRGLDELRIRLDERHDGDRRAWIAALAPLLSKEDVALGASAGGSVTLTGALTMFFTSKLFLGAASIAALVLGLRATGWLAVPLEPAPVVSPLASADSPAVAPDPGPAATPATASDRKAAAVQPASIVLPVGGPMTRVTVRFVDEHGGPLVDVRMSVSVDGISGESVRSGEALGDYPFAKLLDPSMFETRSDAGGVALLESNLLDVPRKVVLTAEARDLSYWTRELLVEPGAEVDLGDVSLAAAGAISGRVVDGSGAPLVGVPINAGSADSRRVPGASRDVRLMRMGEGVRTDEQGAFRCPGIPPGDSVLWARTDLLRSYPSEVVDVRASEEIRDVVIVIDETKGQDSLIRVRVVSPQGDPVPAHVIARMVDGRTSGGRTDDQGRRVFGDNESAPRIAEILAMDAKGKLGYAIARDLLPSRDERTLTLGGASQLELQVVDSNGDPVEHYRASLFDAEFRSGLHYPYSGSGNGPHRNGRAALGATDREARIEVAADGYAIGELGPFDPLAAAAAGPVRITLEALPGVSGRVLVDGGPVRGARVELHAVSEPGQLNICNSFPTLIQPLQADSTRTDTDGLFRLDVRETGRYVLRVRVEGHAETLSPELELDKAVGAAGVVIHVPRAGRLEGVYSLSDGRRPAGAIIGITRGSLDSRTTRTDREGNFVFEDLAPGRWFVQERTSEVEVGRNISFSSLPVSYAWEHPYNCEIEAGETTHFELEADAPARNRLSGRFTLGSDAMSGWEVSLEPARDGNPLDDRDAVVVGSIDADGNFELEADVRPGTYLLSFQDRSGTDTGVDVTQTVSLDGTEREFDLVLEAGTLTGVLPAGRKPHFYAWKGADGLQAVQRIQADESDVFRIERLPAGPARIVTYGSHGSLDHWEWPLVAEVHVEEGKSTYVEAR